MSVSIRSAVFDGECFSLRFRYDLILGIGVLKMIYLPWCSDDDQYVCIYSAFIANGLWLIIFVGCVWPASTLSYIDTVSVSSALSPSGSLLTSMNSGYFLWG